jgi:hypothetical protein
MTSTEPATRRPFTVAVCTPCSREPTIDVVSALRATIRRCPHGVLATTACLRGPLSCRARPHDRGVMIVLQPCTTERAPHGPTAWIGPIRDDADLEAVRGWIESGHWDLDALPTRLNARARIRLAPHLN